MRRLALLLCGSLVVLLGAPSAPAGPSRVHEVIMSGGPAAILWTYEPDDLTIKKRDRIAWSNATSTTHHVTFYDAPIDASLHVPAGGAEVKRFKKKGVYLYRCDISGHSLMVGDNCLGMCGRFEVE